MGWFSWASSAAHHAASAATSEVNHINTAFPTIAHLEQFVDGLLYVLHGQIMISQVHTCMKDGESIAGEFSSAISDFGHFDKTHIEDAIKQTGKMIHQFPQMFNDCEALKTDMIRIAAWASVFEDPMALAGKMAWNVVPHLFTLIGDAKQLYSDIHSGNYHAAGEDVGHIMNIAIGPVGAAPAPK